MRRVIALFALSAVTIGAAWALLGAPLAVPGGGIKSGDKLYCVSYAPFRRGQSPLDLTTHIDPAQIEDDLGRLAEMTDCVRTYSVNLGLDRVAEIAGRHGLKVLQGMWLSGQPKLDQRELDVAVELANKYPNVIRAVVVGNEVLLRGELSAPALAARIAEVKAQVRVPVTYADVWEFWLQNPALAAGVDFITIHMLPYWEDFPIPARTTAAHVDSIRRRVVAAFPGKDILIGEFGWPSAGRMREGALPSPSNQALLIDEVLNLAKRENFNVNIIEAFDQPWKRAQEGTVGGHWGVFDGDTRQPKFRIGAAVSDHPQWMAQAAGGIVFAGLIFAAAFASRREPVSSVRWIAVAVVAIASGITIGWAIENAPRESFGLGGWINSLALCAVAIAGPIACAAALAAGERIPAFADVLADEKIRQNRLALLLGVTLIVTTVVALIAALGLAFDPRYRDFPFAPLTGAVLPYVLLAFGGARHDGARGVSELVAAALLTACGAYVLINETLANWQSIWLCALLALLAVTLTRVRGVPD